MKVLKRIVMVAVLALAGISATGCHTAHGVGQDVESVGEKIQDTTR